MSVKITDSCIQNRGICYFTDFFFFFFFFTLMKESGPPTGWVVLVVQGRGDETQLRDYICSFIPKAIRNHNVNYIRSDGLIGMQIQLYVFCFLFIHVLSTHVCIFPMLDKVKFYLTLYFITDYCQFTLGTRVGGRPMARGAMQII